MTSHMLTRRQALVRISAGVAALQLGLPAAAAAAQSAPLSRAATTTLQAWISRGAPQSDLIAQQIQKYNNEVQSSGVEWQFQNITDDIDAKLAAAAAAGS